MTQLVMALVIVALAAGILTRRAWCAAQRFFEPPAPKPVVPTGFHPPGGCGGCPMSGNCTKK